MSITKERKKEIISQFGDSTKDCGKTEVQVSIFTDRIKTLTQHFKIHKKDNHSRYGLLQMVNNRRKLLNYLKSVNEDRYQVIIKELGLRR